MESKGKKNRIHQLAKAANIECEGTIPEVKPGWVVQAKGMLQVAFERGFIDPSEYSPRHGSRQQYYTVVGKKDEYGNLM